MIRKYLKPVFLIFTVFTVITGVVYPLLITGISQVFFKSQANGSLIYQSEKVVGSALIGQPFDDIKYFWGRPSATGPTGFNAAASTGSNYGPMNADYLKLVEERTRILKSADPNNQQKIPVDLVTASGSGLDPHISPAAAQYQITRIASARQMDKKTLQHLVDLATDKPQFGFFGESRVNVLKLNLLLDREISSLGKKS